jgi:hypothetical protein
MLTEATINVPRCWKELSRLDFPEDLKGIKGEKQRDPGNIADPDPYYDDARSVYTVVKGLRIGVHLSSGQGNYFGGFTIESVNNAEEEVVADVISDTLDDVNEITLENGDAFVLKINWV